MKISSIILFTSALILLSPQVSSAQENWEINRFTSNISILNDGYVTVRETIDVDFGSLQKHGIFRDIPFIYSLESGGKKYTKIDVVSVSNSEKQIPFEQSQDNGFIHLKIGDPDRTISGKQSYIISYTVAGVLNSFEDHDEFFWDITGNEWPIPINSVEAAVTLPEEAILQIACFQGVKGFKQNCQFNKLSDKRATFSADNLGAYEGLIAVVGYEKGLVPVLKVSPPKSIMDELFTLTNALVFVTLTLIGIGIVFWLWWDRGRDYWLRKRYIDDPQAKHEIRPIGAHETIVVEFSAPENLRPAEIGTLVDERADTLDVSATIVDLASRGFLIIVEEPKKDFLVIKTTL